MTESKYFFDSHGGLWEICSPEASGAEAFGPHLASRQVEYQPEWSTCTASSRWPHPPQIKHEDGWDWFIPAGPCTDPSGHLPGRDHVCVREGCGQVVLWPSATAVQP